jgi:hypothetical protein
MTTIAYSGALTAQIMRYPLKPPEGPHSIPLSFVFSPQGSTAITGYSVNLAQGTGLGQNSFSQLSCLYIDNSTSPGTTTVSVVGTGQTVSARAFTRGYYSVSATNLNLVILNDSPIGCTVNVIAFNFPVPPVIDEQVSSALGSNDGVIALRVGNVTAAAQIVSPPLGFTPIGGYPTTITALKPFYFITDFDISFVGDGTAFANAGGILCDYNMVVGGSAGIVNAFASFLVPGNGAQAVTTVCQHDGLQLSGLHTFGIYMFSGGTVGVISINAFGGISSSPLTNAQFVLT